MEKITFTTSYYCHPIEIIIETMVPQKEYDEVPDCIQDWVINSLCEDERNGTFNPDECYEYYTERKTVRFGGSWRIVEKDRLIPDDSEEIDPVVITEESGDIIDVYLTPDKHPVAWNRKKKELMESCGMSEEEAEATIISTPFELELFYSLDQGLFAVESEPLGYISIYNPYSGREIKNENL